MRFGIALLAVVAAASLTVGCSKKDGAASGETPGTVAAATTKGSCDMRAKLSSCDNFKPGSDDDVNKAGCGILGGTYSLTSLCSADKGVATCEDDDSLTYYYSDGANSFDADEAKAGCDLIKGKFVALAAPAAPAAPAAAAPPAAAVAHQKPAPKHK